MPPFHSHSHRLDLPGAGWPLWISVPVFVLAALAVGVALCIGGAA